MRHPLRRTLALVAGAVVAFTGSFASVAGAQPSEASGKVPRAYGVLGAKAGHQAEDLKFGIRYFMINVGWDAWEPQQGTINTAYAQEIKTQAESVVKAGGIVGVDFGLQYPPAWASELADGKLKDQNGNVARVAPNYEYSAAVQNAMLTYVRNVVSTLGSSVSQYRLGVSDTGEMMYPNPSSDPANTWWIGSEMTNLPAGVPANPMPGWVPGTPTYQGVPVDSAQAERWYAWYHGALVNVLVRKGETIRAAGFRGQIALNVAGMGVLPPLYKSRVDAALGDPTASDFYGTLNTGTVYQRTIPAVAARVKGPLIVNATGAGDGSGSAGQILCQAKDRKVDVTPGSTDAVGWSSTRWVHALAEKAGLPFEIENARFNSSIALTFELFEACDAQFLGWLNDDSLRDAQNGNVLLHFRGTTEPDPFNGPTYASEIAANPLR